MQYLTEADEEKLKHLEHPEDHMLVSGYAGYHHAVNTLEHAHKILSGQPSEAKISEKFDGSPSIVFGRHPETGRFFVSSKSAFNVDPKINYTESDIEKNHGHAPGLVTKLKTALKHLPKIMPKSKSPKGEVFQGDLMYSKDGKDNDVEHKGGKFHFTPNTITYSAKEGTATGRKIDKAKIGIAVHTRYKGKSLSDMKAEFNADLSDLADHPDVHAIVPNKKIDPKKFKSEDKVKFASEMKKADEAYKGVQHEPPAHIEAHHDKLKSFLHQSIVNGTKPSFDGYKSWLTDKSTKEIQKVKTPAVKAAKVAQHEVALSQLHKNKQHFESLINTHKHLINAKNILVHNFNQSPEFETHVGGTKVKPEGTVISINNRPSKLNDREEFNRLNALKSKNLKKPAEDESKTVMAFGRMNPPTVGHAKLVDTIKDEAEKRNAKHLLVLSHSHDKEKNPLTAEQKLKHAKVMFPNTNITTSSEEHPTIFHHLSKLYKQGTKEVTIVAGSDRLKQYQKMIPKYNKVQSSHGYYNFNNIHFVSSGNRDPDSEGVVGMSASKMRSHAAKNDFEQFKKGLPKHVSDQNANLLYKDVRKGMGLKESLSFMNFFKR